KEQMRQLALRGGRYTSEEARALLDYCQSDVEALKQLLPAMISNLDLDRAVLRGRYMKAVATMEHCGVPIDVDVLKSLRSRWDRIKLDLIKKIDAQYGIYDGTTFKVAKFQAWLELNQIPWPSTEDGRLELNGDTFRAMAKMYPCVAPLHELRHSLSDL